MGSELTQEMLGLPPGDHLCLFYEQNPGEQMPALVPFIQEALTRDEQFIYIADDQTVDELSARLEQAGIEVGKESARRRLKLWTRDKWRQPGELESERKAKQVRQFIKQASRAGFKGIRFAVEMTWTLGPAISTEQLEHWEATINQLFVPEFPGRIICQYNRSRLAPEVLLAALHTHPLAVLGEHVYPNFFYQAPLILSGHGNGNGNSHHANGTAERVDWMIAQLKRAYTAEKAREELIAKHASDAQIHQLMMLMPAGVYTCDAEGRVAFFNRRAAELLGCEPKLGETHEQFCRSFRLWRLDGSPLPRDQAPMASALENLKSHRNTEVIVERPDGSKIIVSASVEAIRDSAGRFCGVISVFQDVSELKKNQDARASLAAIVESSEDAIIGKDLNGIITSWNAGAEKLYGYTAEEVIGKSICILNAPSLKLDEPQILDRLRHGEKIERYKAVHVAKDGSRVEASVTVSPIRDATGCVIGASRIARDISERKKADAELAAWHHELETRVAKRTEELHRAYEILQDEVEERTRLETEIARAIEREQLRLGQELHDGLGQELTGIAYHMAALRSRLDRIAPAYARDVKKLESIILRSVEQTRNLARGFYPVDLEAQGLPSALRQLASSTKDSFGVSCTVMAEKTSSGALTGPVAIQFFRIAQEAVHNSVKHAKANQILIRLSKTDGHVALTVQDNGVGLPRNFAEVKGMGLRIMQHRAGLIGAKMEFGNGPDKGAVITCSVPHDERLVQSSKATTASEKESVLTFL